MDLISYGMIKYKGFNAFMATYQNGDYPNLEYLPGLKIEFVPKITGNFVKDACSWLKENGSRIDVLYTFHNGRRTYNFIKAYKSANPNGKVYVEMDGWGYVKIFRKRFWTVPFSLYFQRYVLNNAFVVTEFQEKADMLTKKLKHKIGCVPNPINPDEVAPFREFKDRSNIIFTAGRLGTK